MSQKTPTIVPYRQIRAQYDDTTITVYQAFSPSIANAAVAAQRLDASPDFKHGRMTWVKPSWAWIMYRAGYSYKDARQARILALRVTHEHFLGLLQRGVLSHGETVAATTAAATRVRTAPDRNDVVRIQWDPERTPALLRLPYRSIQIGIPGSLSERWVSEWIVSIEDVTETAKDLKRTLDENDHVPLEVLIERGLVPVERPVAVPDSIMAKLGMTRPEQSP
ncbi:ATP-dependent RNA helicase DHX8 [Beauveria brongniartii RCEF 3172]|uniref:ATP-dependent RNA helicase DHX8 n=1 Tax=Beauveria brongniartii RCEF 3172 TaxID=1081107 RepID=A0A166Y4S3_9HYPO|nr:ATP-dependent RNA helicase DHX8 [Beauveria brongniartii RCEF 3172]